MSYENAEGYVVLADTAHQQRHCAQHNPTLVSRAEEQQTCCFKVERARNRRVDEMIRAIREIALQEPFPTLTTIKEKFEVRLLYKPYVHISTVARHLNNRLISLKIIGKDADVSYRRSTETTKERRFQYIIWLLSVTCEYQGHLNAA